jgi:hemerythrin-like metal-binding protein
MAGHKWQKRYELGVPELDEHHRQYFRLVEAFDVHAMADPPDRDLMCNVFGRLLEHAREHFRAEEAYMEKIRYPEAERQRHVQAHDDFVAQVSKLAQHLKFGNPDAAREEIAAFLSDWLVNHILEMDVKYIQFFKSRQG